MKKTRRKAVEQIASSLTDVGLAVTEPKEVTFSPESVGYLPSLLAVQSEQPAVPLAA